MIEKINEIKYLIKEADGILITAGAGMGVDSGLPDFRGQEGFLKAYPQAKEHGLNFEDLANPCWFKENPKLAWAFYGHRYYLYKNTKPHDGFNMLLELVKEKNENYFIYTSNVDGQFQKAGFDKDKIVECHGNINKIQCSSMDKKCNGMTLSTQNNFVYKFEDNLILDNNKFETIKFPVCPVCKESALRPNILMFNDSQWIRNPLNSQEERFNKWIKQFKKKKRKLVIIEIGAGTSIPTIRLLGDSWAKKYRDSVKLIRINPRDFHIESDIGYSLSYGAVDGLKKIIEHK